LEGKWIGATERVLDFVKKFKRPLLVCVTDTSKAQRTSNNGFNELLNQSKHLLTQWSLDVPIVLLILANKISFNVLAIRLADRIVAAEQTDFFVTFPEHKGRARCDEIDARSLVESGVIDKTFSAAPAFATKSIRSISFRLRDVLLQTFDEVTYGSENERRIRRKRRLDQIEAMLSRARQ